MTFRFLFLLIVCGFLFSCEKEYSAEGGPSSPVPSSASVVTTAVSGITTTEAVSGGTVAIAGTTTVSARGVCWNTTADPTVALATKTNDGTGAGVFSSSLSGLIPNTTYYVRAYIITGTGIYYGAAYSFTTAAVSSSASVITTDVSAITVNSAVSGGTVTVSGSTTVTARGVCWSTTTAPSTALSTKTNDGTGAGVFNSNLTGLAANTLYYIRAYIITSAGTFYGAEKTFTTSAAPVTVTIGATYGGGVVAYVLQPGDPGYDPAVQHGIVIAPETNLLLDWSLQDFGTFVLTNATGTAIGTGASNTSMIIAVEGPGNYAAKYCDDLVLNGYNDWLLPSKDELYAVYQNRALTGGMPYTAYWTSTEGTLTGAIFLLTLAPASFQYGYKGSPANVRAIRYF